MQGSSPLTRGKPSGSKIHIAGIGLIPAHAGKTPPWADSPSPRSGSSPLTRGKRHVSGRQRPPRGLIPAHAGKTRPGSKPPSGWAAHPRSRGENAEGAIRAEESKGSSPLTRGKRGPPGRCRGLSGLIPAHAGKTLPCLNGEFQTGAHPRSRGENPVFLEIPGKGTGSSPLTRGKLLPLFYPPVKQGLIPAHAGKTVRSGTRRHRTAAHPRSRGENRSLRTFAV